jgi:hypothetical protein
VTAPEADKPSQTIKPDKTIKEKGRANRTAFRI